MTTSGPSPVRHGPFVRERDPATATATDSDSVPASSLSSGGLEGTWRLSSLLLSHSHDKHLRLLPTVFQLGPLAAHSSQLTAHCLLLIIKHYRATYLTFVLASASAFLLSPLTTEARHDFASCMELFLQLHCHCFVAFMLIKL